MQRRGGVVEREQRDLAARDDGAAHLPVRLRDAVPAARERARGEVAERRHDARAHELDLPLELVAAGCDLLGGRALRARRDGT